MKSTRIAPAVALLGSQLALAATPTEVNKVTLDGVTFINKVRPSFVDPFVYVISTLTL